MKRANGTGSIVHLPGRRRRPWAVRVSGRGESGRVVQRLVSYHERAADAQSALEEYNRRDALRRALDNFEFLGLDGLLLFAGSNVVAFSIGGRMHERYYDVMFEKADADIPGAYPLINREFARMVREKYPAVEFLNREDDMGEEGLRKAKESYQPTVLLRKYTADWQEDAS